MPFLDFFATGQGVLTLGIMAALIVLLWDWRVALVALVLIQIGVAALLTQIEGVSGQIMFVQSLIVGLSAVMVAMAALQVHLRRSGRQSGGWLFRLLVLALLGIALYSLDLTVVLPDVAPAITRIFGWIALIALIMLSLGDNPVFTITALLVWCVLGQAMSALYAPAPEVMITIGLMELVLGLAASYLLLAEELPRRQMATLNATRAAARQLPPGFQPGNQPGMQPSPAPQATGTPLMRRAPTGTQTNLPAVPAPNATSGSPAPVNAAPQNRIVRGGTEYNLPVASPTNAAPKAAPKPEGTPQTAPKTAPQTPSGDSSKGGA